MDKEYQQLKAENEKLKSKNEKLKEKCKYWENNSYFHVYIKTRKCLEEIKNIASPHCSQCVDIIDKINKVLN